MSLLQSSSKDYGGANRKSSSMLKILMETLQCLNMNINSFIHLLIIYMFLSWLMDAMEEKSLSAKKRERVKEEDAEQNLMEESVQEDEIESTPLAFSTPVTGKRRGRPSKTATSVKTPDVKSMHVQFYFQYLRYVLLWKVW